MLLYQKRHFGFKRLKLPFLYFFVLYSIYIFIDITWLGGKGKVDPNESFPLPAFFMKSLTILLLCICAETIIKNFSCYKFILASLFLVVLPAIAYIQVFGSEVLQMARLKDGDPDQLGVLALGYAGAVVFVISLITAKEMIKVSIVKALVSLIIACLGAYLIIISGERGPILWGIVNLWICIMIKSRNMMPILIVVIIICLFLYLNVDFIIEQLLYIAPKTAEKLYNSFYGGDTSERFIAGDKGNSIYVNALNQFLSSPIWGSYFRLLKEFSPYAFGRYPHNVFLEIMITMGLVGLLPFCSFLYKIFKGFRKVREKTLPIMGCFAIFLAEFLELLTSGTLVLHMMFWPFFYILYIVSTKPESTKVNIQVA